MPTKTVPLSTWVSPADAEALDHLLAKYHRASRHQLAVACLRAGLATLAASPERGIELMPGAADKVRLRQPLT